MVKSLVSEKQIESEVTKYAVKNGFFERKIKETSKRGFPDRIFISPAGQVVFIEFKATNKKPTALQTNTISKLKDYKQNVFVIDSIEKGKQIINAYI